MQIRNKTQGWEIETPHAKSFLSRARGLMLRSRQPLLIEAPFQSIEATSIHMWFMRFPIDAVWIDENLRAVDVYENAKPFSIKIFRPKQPAKYVLELPVGSKKTKIGDIFIFKHPTN